VDPDIGELSAESLGALADLGFIRAKVVPLDGDR